MHGIATQPLIGDHAGVARAWASTEGPSTVCLYHVEARDPEVVRAYVAAGHTVVTLGGRTDPAFLGRLHTLLSGAARIVSNRLSTPVLYAASIGRDAVVSGEAMRLAGEPEEGVLLLRERFPEFYEQGVPIAEKLAVARDETGADALLPADELRRLMRWDRRHVGPWLEHWISAPTSRALTQLRRHSGVAPGTKASGDAAPSLNFTRWLAAAAEYLPRPLGHTPASPEQPIRVATPRRD
jgi:hypothetical protein